MSGGKDRPTCCEQLLQNERQLMINAVKVLIRCAANILRWPDDPKYRRLPVANVNIQQSLLPAYGAIECLFEMGFVEAHDHFLLPETASLSRVQTIHDALLELSREFREVSTGHEGNSTGNSAENFVGNSTWNSTRQDEQLVAAFWHQKEMAFHAELKRSIGLVANYLKPELLVKARACVPLKQLTERAKECCQQMKQSDTFVQDHLLVQLLGWFKESFFQWMDHPSCSVCGGNTALTGRVPALAEEMSHLAHSVENYCCQSGCVQSTRFPRYNDPGRLLETRVGRCGEWANCFTLVCLAAGLDARYVVDWGDHVWTEVYSTAQGRWLHADPCENECDRPLLYEAGWGKKMSYVIAFSTDDIQDVTWRYTAQPGEVLRMRTACRESWLVHTIVSLRKSIQQERLVAKVITAARLRALEERTALELVELMMENKSTGNNLPGRTTGSEEWRRARGELGPTKSHTIVPTDSEVETGVLELRYSCVKDEYLRVSDNQTVVSGWQNLVHEVVSVFRKLEHDWKMAYLARTEGAELGKVVWMFDVGSQNLCIDRVEVVVKSTCFESGHVNWTLTDTHSGHCASVVAGCRQVFTELFTGCTTLCLSAELTGGTGPTAWQHAQLFRQSLTTAESHEYPLNIILHLSRNG